jgi:hypothetical protein
LGEDSSLFSAGGGAWGTLSEGVEDRILDRSPTLSGCWNEHPMSK